MKAIYRQDEANTVTPFQQMVEVASDVIYTTDATGHFTYANAAIERMLGYSPASVIGKHFTDLVQPEWRERVVAFYNEQFLRRIPETILEFPVVNRAGGETWVEQTVVLIMRDEDVVGFHGIVRDITAHKQVLGVLNEHIQQLEIMQRLDAELTHNLKTDYVLKITLDAGVRLSAADAGTIHLIEGDQLRVVQIIGAYPAEMLRALVPIDEGIMGRVIRTGQPEMVLDVTRDPDYVARIPDIRAQMTVPLITHDRIIGVMSVQIRKAERFTSHIFELVKMVAARAAASLDNARLHEMTEQQVIELQEVYQHVRDLEQLKTQVIRVGAHDLRNPLAVISGYLQLLETMFPGHPEESSILEYLGTIAQAVQRMDKITNDILTLEHVESLAAGTLTNPVELQTLIAGVVMDHTNQAVTKSQRIQVDLFPELLIVAGDEVFLREAISNLVNNAIKYTPNGGDIIINLKRDDMWAVFEVTDTGYGVPEAAQPNLFQPFFRVISPETRTTKGTGLGLHLVKTIIERHQGEIIFFSQHGKGSTFGFQLPLMGFDPSSP
ncbi:MAG: PAS domain S-box protein [Anaerolineae bacterium]|nr:PAS domain S-box protein [Anaerolineae bacterium]